MRSVTPSVLLLCAALSVAGCSDEYEIAADYRRGANSPGERASEPGERATEPGERATGPTDSVSRPDAPEPLTEGDASREPAEPRSGEQAGVERESAPAVAPSPEEASPASPGSSPQTKPQPLISLSTGVALAQTLPTGTAMGFSVDYQFAVGRPGSSPYVWVIVPSKGRPAKQAVRLEKRGTLQMFFPQFRPENGPFKTHIEDARGNPVSRSLSLTP